jgi:hypothetical protein
MPTKNWHKAGLRENTEDNFSLLHSVVFFPPFLILPLLDKDFFLLYTVDYELQSMDKLKPLHTKKPPKRV